MTTSIRVNEEQSDDDSQEDGLLRRGGKPVDASQ
jgi:hypothetical protein